MCTLVIAVHSDVKITKEPGSVACPLDYFVETLDKVWRNRPYIRTNKPISRT